jgi:hypothetical protein
MNDLIAGLIATAARTSSLILGPATYCVNSLAFTSGAGHNAWWTGYDCAGGTLIGYQFSP